MFYLLSKRKASNTAIDWPKRAKLCEGLCAVLDLSYNRKEKRKLRDNNSHNFLPKHLKTEANEDPGKNIHCESEMMSSNLKFFSIFPDVQSKDKKTQNKAVNDELSNTAYFDNSYWKDDIPKFDEAYLENQNKLVGSSNLKLDSSYNSFQYWKQPATIEEMELDTS
ncbi:unnamed protein product [Clavelina lepadiformis]|uniref:Uncharacterized protein n=1 Tax=Clavelina lepadiformis TaxID=159417 RepID=A0ABP0FKH0_CLALP